MNTKIERKLDCFLMKTFCVETNYKNLYGWGVWAVIAANNNKVYNYNSPNALCKAS